MIVSRIEAATVEFESAPRSPAEAREFAKRVAAWEAQAKQFVQGRVEFFREQYSAGMQTLTDVRLAMRTGGANLIGKVPVDQLLQDRETMQRRLAEAEEVMSAACDDIEKISGPNAPSPVAQYEAHLQRFPALANKIAPGEGLPPPSA